MNKSISIVTLNNISSKNVSREKTMRPRKKGKRLRARGRVSWNPKGFAFIVDSNSKADIFVSRSDLSGAMDGDLVEVSANRDKKGLRGKVTSIIRHKELTIGGHYRRLKRWGTISPFKPLPYNIMIPFGSEDNARDGEIVIAKLDSVKAGPSIRTLTAKVIDHLRIPENADPDLIQVVSRHALPWLFSREVEKAAKDASKIDYDRELGKRRDIRKRLLFTIDGRDAKDFDDAIGIEKLPDGTYLLTVAIADVTALIDRSHVLDKEAFKRSFSVYFPDTAIPMLPGVLSDDVLSLKPGEDRLAVAVEIRLGKSGKIINHTCYEAVLRSRARLCYEDLGPYLEGKAAPPVDDPLIIDSLQTLNKVATMLYEKRKSGGSLDFDLPEVGVELDAKGTVTSIFKRERDPSQRIIEESMILANRVVCKTLLAHKMPVLYRVHEPPSESDILRLKETLKVIGMEKHYLDGLERATSQTKAMNKALQEIAQGVSGNEIEGFVHRQILRSLKQAEYSGTDKGHFGLGFEGYLHFTSPIRRYPDIIIHRLLKKIIQGKSMSRKEFNRWQIYLKKVSPVLSEKERLIQDTMMQVIRLKKTSYMADHIGESFKGVVSGIQPYGIFVDILDPPVEGLIPETEIAGAKILADRSVKIKRRTIKIGDIVNVQVAGVDRQQGYIDLSLE